MTTLVFLALVLTFVSSTTTSQTTTGEISIIEEGSLEAGSELILSCTIPDFTGTAQWSRDNNIYTTCLDVGLCSVVNAENYTFGSNASGIFVTINHLSKTDNGSIWMCNNHVYTTSYTVIVQSTFVPPPGEFSIVGKGSFEAGSVLLLSCIIPTFTGHASLSRENVVYTICTPDACDTNPMVNYTFASNTSGIFVSIDPLTMTENGTKWHCNHNFDNTFYTVFVQSSTTTSTIATGMLSLFVQGSSEVDSTLILSCIIPTFTGSATWSRENIIKSTCFHDLCFPYMQQHYTFSSNNSDIFVAIYPLSMTENGTTWTCYHGDDSASYTVLVQSSITTNQPPTESTFVPPPGELSIVVKGSFEAGSALLLSCIIPTFTGFALWYRDNVLYAYCTPDTCDTDKPMVNSNTSGIFVLIDPLTMTENGTEWGCSHNFYNTFYTVFVQPSITTNQPPTDSCQEPYQKIGNGCYSIHDDNISGDEAFASCADPGAYLANFETLEEAMFMKVFLQRNKTGISYFVGGRNVNRYLSSGDWRWMKHGNATKMTYFAFAPGQPSWSAEKGEDCMFFYANDRYNFYNVMCDNGHFLGGFICEI